MNVYLGIDIGGTKCALVLGDKDGAVLQKVRFDTTDRDGTLARMMQAAEQLIGAAEAQGDAVKAIGISCGGPLDSVRGLIQSPPNLPDWDNVPIVQMLHDAFGIPVALCQCVCACRIPIRCRRWLSQHGVFDLWYGHGRRAGFGWQAVRRCK